MGVRDVLVALAANITTAVDHPPVEAPLIAAADAELGRVADALGPYCVRSDHCAQAASTLLAAEADEDLTEGSTKTPWRPPSPWPAAPGPTPTTARAATTAAGLVPTATDVGRDVGATRTAPPRPSVCTNAPRPHDHPMTSPATPNPRDEDVAALDEALAAAGAEVDLDLLIADAAIDDALADAEVD